jgi:hypothetical protein
MTRFPDPALLPRHIERTVREDRLVSLPEGRVGLRDCGRCSYVGRFRTTAFPRAHAKIGLYRLRAELQNEQGGKLLKSRLHDHFLIGMVYFLHEKCQCLAMGCLRKLTLISLRKRVTNQVIKIGVDSAREIMQTKDYEGGLTIAVVLCTRSNGSSQSQRPLRTLSPRNAKTGV